MPAFQIVVDRRPERVHAPFRKLAGPKGLVDFLVDGTNVTARLGDAEVVPLLRDLSLAIADLAALRRGRASFPCLGGEEPWELGVERAGAYALLSLFRAGPVPEVAVFERRVEGTELVLGTLEAIEEALAHAASESVATELRVARATLAGCSWPLLEAEPSLVPVPVETDGEAPIRFGAEIALRETGSDAEREPTVERSDLLGLLFRGPLRVQVGDRARDVGDTFVFLAAERLVELSAQALEAWESGRPFYRRVSIDAVHVAVRLGGPREATAPGGRERHAESSRDAGLSLTLGGPRAAGFRNAWTFPCLEVPAFVQAALAFGRSLVRTLLRRSPGHAKNLRVTALREAMRELDERLREAVRDDAKVNEAPESYRAFAELSRRPSAPAGDWGRAKIRFSPRWVATVPGIDLRATFLCGDRLIVGGARETACLDRTTGHVLWRAPTSRAVSVVTPAGLARLAADGTIAVHDFGTGEVSLRVRVAPRVGGTAAGAVVNAPGLPRLLVVVEGERHLSAIDLASGEIRWRNAAHRGSSFRLRRAGKLLVVATGEPSLTALDVTNGDIVWRVRDRLRFSTPIALDHDSLFAVAGDPSGASGAARLHHLDPWAGTTRWSRELPTSATPIGAPLVTRETVILPVRDRRGVGLHALDRASGETAFAVEPGLAPLSSSWLVVDDAVVVNGDDGVLAALDARTGATIFRHVFDRAIDGDQPRKLEPILRSGALFVPQHEVHVVRPRDGELLGKVPCDLIPDLLRVDERCAVYVAEESGHVAAFEAGARLSLVK